jgi:hypothetical protein
MTATPARRAGTEIGINQRRETWVSP